MGREIIGLLCALAALLTLCYAARPMGGKFTGERALKQELSVASDNYNNNAVCRSLILYDGGHISVHMKGRVDKGVAQVLINVEILRSHCANFGKCDYVYGRTASGDIVREKEFTFLYDIRHGMISQDLIMPFSEAGRTTKREDPAVAVPDKVAAITTSDTTPPPSTTDDVTLPPPNNKTKWCNSSSSGLYIVRIKSAIQQYRKANNVALMFHVEMRNTYGYLSATDYPALVSYSVMTVVYAILGLVWSVAMCCSYRDLVRLQFWVFAVIILGFLEKIFFVSEYSSINLGEQPSFLILVAETVSAVKRGLARVLLIIVCLGFGTFKPRLGDSLGKVVAVGIIYTIFALIDGIVRSKAETYDTDNTSQIVTLALLFIMDSIIFYWAFTSLVSVRRALRLRKNYVKLSMYNHFAYTLKFSIVAALGFTVWVFMEVNFPKKGCLKDWREVWLRDCFWHFLFCIILIVIMIIWRPSANKNRFAYSLVNDLDQEEDEEEEMENKNFETLKMRTVSRSDGTTPPPVSSTQAEDDLRWVEENLPTTAMDKALPLILDSDEEVMNTKFEASKMN